LLSINPRKYTFHATAIDEEKTIQNYFSDKFKIVIIPNYIYLPQLVEKTYSREYILFLGRIHPDKALDKLIDAFLLLKSNPTYLNIKLVLTGDLNSKY
jgi:glycosyltransferase involved in cell wall biosynthesis